MEGTELIDALVHDVGSRVGVKKALQVFNASTKEHAGYVDYQLADKNLKVLTTHENEPCFANLAYSIRKLYRRNKKTQYLLYKVKRPENALAWVKLCAKYGFLDPQPYNDLKDILSHGIAINVADYDKARLYTHLCTARYLQEANHMVAGILTLVELANRDMMAAYYYLHPHSKLNTGHSLLSTSDGFYQSRNKICDNSISVPLKLKELANKNTLNETFLELSTKNLDEKYNNYYDFYWGGWQYQQQHARPEIKIQVKNRMMLLADDVYPIATAFNISKAKSLAQKLNNSKHTEVKFAEIS